MKYFKCNPDTNLFFEIQLLREKIKSAKDQIKAWAESNGIKEWMFIKRHLVNRPSFVKFEEGVTPPDGWRFYKKEQAYAPDSRSKAGKKIIDEIRDLPIVEKSELGDLFKFEDFQVFNDNGSFSWYQHPIVYFRDSCHAVAYPIEYPHEIHPELVEITASEFEQIKSKEN